MKKVLFVCLGNICRSPAAQAVFENIVEKNNDQSFKIDSAGTSAFHAGERADARMIEHGRKRGFNLTSISRQFISTDLNEFDHIICMDQKNYKNVIALCDNEEQENKVQMMLDYSRQYKKLKSVPDPYYGGADGFEEVYDLLEESCEQLYLSLK